MALGDPETWLAAIGNDWRGAELASADRVLLEFVELLTLRPGRVRRVDVEALRAVGFSETGIHDIIQVVALFSYYNRLADGLGAEDEPEWTARPETSS